MPERDGYIPGVPCWIDTSQPDPMAAVEFYRDLFGWDFENVMPEGSEGQYFIARIRGGDVAAVGPTPPDAPAAATWNTYVLVGSADEAASKVKDAGGQVDPEGAVFSVWQAGRHQGARVVNEAGSLNFNGLHTRDAQAAKSFYGSVFGWRTLAMGGDTEMWTLPGYGDHLEQNDPGIRERLAEFGGPAGFEDVVASINPIAPEETAVPPHWSVIFAVDDADATAAKADELGGRVVVAPFDAPWVRSTVIADPQGATFIANQFMPENRDAGAEAGVSASAA
jgi:predicted enzyme related to lactoylglutathione lyase